MVAMIKKPGGFVRRAFDTGRRIPVVTFTGLLLVPAQAMSQAMLIPVMAIAMPVEMPFMTAMFFVMLVSMAA